MFRIDIEDGSGERQGGGPLVNIGSVTIRRALDKMGSAVFSLPATDPKAAGVQRGRWYRLYHEDYGEMGVFRHAKQRVSPDSRTLTVEADDQLISLMHKNCYWRRAYENQAVDTVVSSLLSLAGWSDGSIETGIGNTSVVYQGESVFEAIDLLRDRWGQHFRLGTLSSTLDFGGFGTASGIRAVGADSFPREAYRNDDICLITGLEITEESQGVVNRLIPVGAGVGTTQLTLEQVTSEATGYAVQSATNADGTALYYIEDATSQGTYGVIEKPFVRSDIAPLTNSGTSLENAANTLYRTALAALLRWKDERTFYSLSVAKLDPRRLRVGQTIRVVYRGLVKHRGWPDYKWVDIDTDLHVMDIEERYGAGGEQSVHLAVASTDARRTSDSDVISQVVRETRVFATHVQPNLTHSPVGPYVKRLDSSNPATFYIRLKDEVLAVNRVLLRFRTSPLRSSIKTISGSSTTTPAGGGSVITSASGGGTAITSGGGGDHEHAITVYNDAPGGSDKPVYVNEDGLFDRFIADWGGNTNILSSEAPDHTHSISIPSHSHGVSVPNHQHTFTPNVSTTYGIYNDTQYPQVISVAINGTDRTVALGGTWAGSNAAVDVEVDITDYISRGQSNSVRFSCTGGQGEVEFLADCLLTIQAIVVV